MTRVTFGAYTTTYKNPCSKLTCLISIGVQYHSYKSLYAVELEQVALMKAWKVIVKSE